MSKTGIIQANFEPVFKDANVEERLLA